MLLVDAHDVCHCRWGRLARSASLDQPAAPLRVKLAWRFSMRVTALHRMPCNVLSRRTGIAMYFKISILFDV
eukprot:6201785-Pleurochrysis_carterae.AAC.2